MLGWAGYWVAGLAGCSLRIRPELVLGFCKYLNIGLKCCLNLKYFVIQTSLK
jgi:hypothetical protein